MVSTFRELSDEEKREAIVEIVQEAGLLDYQPLDDEAITRSADERLLALDVEKQADDD